MKTIEELLQAYGKDHGTRTSEPLVFTGTPNHDVYNISARFKWNDGYYIAGRVEKRDSEISEVCFFKEAKGLYRVTDHRLKDMQDPHVTCINGRLLVGGTKIYHEDGAIVSWRTVYYKGSNFSGLKPFLEAPLKMKDLRLHKDGSGVHAFTRPQGGEAGPGKIGYLRVDELSELSTDNLSKVPILFDHFPEGSWGGVNDVHTLKDGRLGILGHIATMDERGHRHYYGMVFAFDPLTARSTDLKLVCTRDDFPEDEVKRKDLIDVVFPGGLVRHEDGSATLYAGVSDAKAYRLRIPDPFKDYETGDEQ